MPDVFVSHATADDKMVTKIHAALKSAGLDVWVDHEDGLNPGDNWSAEIHDAVKDCHAGLFIMSPNSAKSTYCEAEWQRILALGKKLYIASIEAVPLADIPLRLGIIQYTDLTRDFDGGIKQLVHAIQGKKDVDPAALTTKRARKVTGRIDRRLTSIPISGRDRDMDKIKSLLREGPTAILGVGGLGKSRLAAEITVASADVHSAMWHTCSDISRPDNVFELLRNHLELELTTERHEVMEKLRAHKCLVVLDNAESVSADDPRRKNYVALVDDLVDHGAQVLLTSRVEWDEVARCKRHAPVTLPLEAAKQVVLDMGKAEGVEGLEAQAGKIAQAARQHPKLIEWAIGQMRRFGVGKVIRDLEALKSKMVQAALDEMIGKTLRQMVERAKAGDMSESVLKRLCVFRGGFSYEVAKAICIVDNGVTSDSGKLPADEDDFDAALDTLQQWRFVTYDRAAGRYTVDPMVITAVSPDEKARRPHYDYYEALANKHDKKQDYLGLDVESDNLEAAFEWAFGAGDYEAAYWLANACGHFLGNRGRFDQRLDWFERAAAKLADVSNDRLRADVQVSLGIIYQNHPTGNRRDNLKRATTNYKKALEHYRPDVAPLAYAMTQNNLGTAYSDLSKVEEREENLRRAILAFQEALVHRRPDVTPLAYATTQNNLGNAYRALAGVEEREKNLKRAVLAYEEALVYRRPDVAPLDYAGTQMNLAGAYWQISDIEDKTANLQLAVTAYEEALRFHKPASNPLGYAKAHHGLGMTHEKLGDLSAAGDCWREAEKYYRQMGAVDDADLMQRWIEEAEGGNGESESE